MGSALVLIAQHSHSGSKIQELHNNLENDNVSNKTFVNITQNKNILSDNKTNCSIDTLTPDIKKQILLYSDPKTILNHLDQDMFDKDCCFHNLYIKCLDLIELRCQNLIIDMLEIKYDSGINYSILYLALQYISVLSGDQHHLSHSISISKLIDSLNKQYYKDNKCITYTIEKVDKICSSLNWNYRFIPAITEIIHAFHSSDLYAIESDLFEIVIGGECAQINISFRGETRVAKPLSLEAFRFSRDPIVSLFNSFIVNSFDNTKSLESIISIANKYINPFVIIHCITQLSEHKCIQSGKICEELWGEKSYQEYLTDNRYRRFNDANYIADKWLREYEHSHEELLKQTMSKLDKTQNGNISKDNTALIVAMTLIGLVYITHKK